MAYVVRTKKGRFEVRESHATESGPRSRTLVSFLELDDEAIEKASARAEKRIDAEELREAALRAGAPIASSALDRAARETLRLLGKGERMEPMLRRLLEDAVEPERSRDRRPGQKGDISDNARAATQWIGAALGERGRALHELLGLADALPVHVRDGKIGFPRLRSL